MVVMLIACAFAPMIIIAGPAYPANWAAATLLVMTCGTVAGATREQ